MKTGYYFELLTFERMKFLGITKSKTTRDENVENWPSLEISEVVLIYFSTLLVHFSTLVHISTLLIKNINKIQESCIHLFQISHSVNC